MNIVIAGGSGFIGTALKEFFLRKGYQISVLTRAPKTEFDIPWDGKTLLPSVAQLEGTHAIINLSGRSIDCRHTPKNKSEILSSRINSTQAIAEVIPLLKSPPPLWINASGAAIYPESFDIGMGESHSTFANDFTADVCKQWEGALFNKKLTNTRRVALRTPIVLGNTGGAYPKLKLLAKLGLGGRLGNGKQMISWIHIKDYCKVVEFIINNSEISGALNITSPEPITNAHFQKALQQSVNALIGIPTPEFLLRIGAVFINTEPDLILNSSYIIPEKLKRSGFKFDFPKIDLAFNDLNK